MRRASVESSDSSDSDDNVTPIQDVEHRTKKPFATMSEIEKKMQLAGMSSTYDPTEGSAGAASKIPKSIPAAQFDSPDFDLAKFLQTYFHSCTFSLCSI